MSDLVQFVELLQANTASMKSILNASRCAGINLETLSAGALKILHDNPSVGEDLLSGLQSLSESLAEVQAAIQTQVK